MKRTINIMNKTNTLALVLLTLMFSGCDQRPQEQKVTGNSEAVANAAPETNLGPVFKASIEQGIDFTHAGTPSFLKSVFGLDAAETWGRWSNAALAPSVKLIFAEPLPKKFTLVISAQAAGINGTLPTKVRVGDQESTFIVGSQGFSNIKVPFNLNKSETSIEITPPAAVIPKEQGWGNDERKLGIGLSSIKIELN